VSIITFVYSADTMPSLVINVWLIFLGIAEIIKGNNLIIHRVPLIMY
jgi:hypothetical protein